MTEKDYFKIKNFNFKKINYLKSFFRNKKKKKFIKKIKKLYD